MEPESEAFILCLHFSQSISAGFFYADPSPSAKLRTRRHLCIQISVALPSLKLLCLDNVYSRVGLVTCAAGRVCETSNVGLSSVLPFMSSQLRGRALLLPQTVFSLLTITSVIEL